MSEQLRVNDLISLADIYWPNQYKSDTEKYNAIADYYGLPLWNELDEETKTPSDPGKSFEKYKKSVEDSGQVLDITFDDFSKMHKVQTSADNPENAFIEPPDYKSNIEFQEDAHMSLADFTARTLESSEKGSWGEWLSDLGKLGFIGSTAGDWYAQESGFDKYDMGELETWKERDPNFLENALAWGLGFMSGPDWLMLAAIPKSIGTGAQVASKIGISSKLFQSAKRGILSRLERDSATKGKIMFEKLIEYAPNLVNRSTTFGTFGATSHYWRNLATQKKQAVAEGDPNRELDRWSAFKDGSSAFLKEGAVGAVIGLTTLPIEKALGKIAMVKDPKFRHRVATVMGDLGKRPIEAGEMATMHSLYNRIEHGEWYTYDDWLSEFGTNYAVITMLSSPSLPQRFMNLKNRLGYMKDGDANRANEYLETYKSLKAELPEIETLKEFKDIQTDFREKHLAEKTNSEAAKVVQDLVDNSMIEIKSKDLKGLSQNIHSALLLGRDYTQQFIENLDKGKNYLKEINKQRKNENKKPLTEKEVDSLRKLAENDLDQFDLILNKITEYSNTNDPDILKEIELEKAKEIEISSQEYIKSKDPNYDYDPEASIHDLEAKRLGWEKQRAVDVKAEIKAQEEAKLEVEEKIMKGATDVEKLMLQKLKKIEEGDKLNIAKEIKTKEFQLRDIKRTKKPLVDESTGEQITGNIAGTTPIHEALLKAKVNPVNRNKIQIGFEKYMKTNNAKPADYGRVLEFFEFTKNKSIEKITRNDFVRFMASKDIQPGTRERMAYNLSITKFFGAGTKTAEGAAVTLGRTGGFAHDYMIKGTGVNAYIERIADSGTYGGFQIDPGKVTRILPGKKGWNKVRTIMSDNIMDHFLHFQKKGNVKDVNPNVVKVATDFFYNFGNRGVDLFKHEGLLIQNINWNKGVINKWQRSTKKTGLQTKPQRNIEIEKNFPKLWDAMVKAKGDRTEGNLLIDNKGKRLNEAKYNEILEEIIPSDITIEAGGKGKFGLANFRKMIERDALEIAGKHGLDPNTMMTMVNNWLTGRQPINTQQIYQGKYQTLWPEFVKLRKKHESKISSETMAEARKAREVEKVEIKPPEKPPKKPPAKKILKSKELKEEKKKQSKEIIKEVTEEVKTDEEVQRTMSLLLKKGGKHFKDSSEWKSNVFKASQKIKQIEISHPDNEAKQLSSFRTWAKNNLHKRYSKKIKDMDLTKELFNDGKKYGLNEFQDAKDLANTVRRRFHGIAEKLGFKDATDKSRLREKIALMSELSDPLGFKLNNEYLNDAIKRGTVTEGHLMRFLNKLDTLTPMDKRNLKRSIKIFENVRGLEEFRKMAERDGQFIDDKTHDAMLELLRIPKKNLYLASEKQLQRYAGMLMNEGFEFKLKGNLFETMDLQEIAKDRKSKEHIKYLENAGRMVQPAEEIITKYLGKDMMNRLYAHAAVKTKYIGTNSIWETKAMRILGGVVKDGKVIQQDFAETNPYTRRHFNKVQDAFQFNDKQARELYTGVKINGKLAIRKDLRQFVKKAFDKEGNYRTDTVEGHAMRSYNEYMKEYRRNVEEIVKTILPPNKSKEVLDNIKFLDQYAHLDISEKYLEHFTTDHDPQQRALYKRAEGEAKILAKKKYGEKPTKKQVEEFYGEGLDRAKVHITRARRFGKGNLDIHSLGNRIELDAKYRSPIDGKEYTAHNLDKWYQTSHKKYVYNIAQSLANLEYFPEVMKITSGTYRDWRATLQDLQSATVKNETKAIRDYLVTVMGRTLGIGEHANPLYGTEGWLTLTANVHARTVLSGPLKGLKNFLIGNPMTTMSFGTANYLISITQALRTLNRDMIKGAGHVDAGMKDYVLPLAQGTGKFFDYIANLGDKGAKALFWTGFMRPAENVNRYTSVLASLIEQRMLGESLKFGDEKSKALAEKRFTSFYEATPKEIEMVKNFGLVQTDMISWGKIKNQREMIRTRREYDNMRQKFNFMAHARTHGVSLDIFLPKFAGGRIMKPMLLFKRMAYLATANTNRGMKEIIDQRAYHKLFSYLGWNLLGGATRAAIMYNFIGAPMPDENSPWYKQLAFYAWMNEVGGILSEFLSPYIGKESIATSFTPFILENLNQAIHLTASVVPTHWREKAFVGKAIRGAHYVTGFWQGTAWDDTAEQTYTLKTAADTYVRKTVGLWNDIRKDIDYRQNPFNAKHKQFDKWYYDYLDKEGKNKTGEFKRTEQSMYYKELKNVFLKGTKEEFARMYSTLTYHMFQKYLEDWRDEGTAWKKTVAQMKRYMKALSPIRASSEHYDFTASRREQYLLSLPRNKRKELLKFETSFKYRLDEYLNYTNDFWRKYRIDDLPKHFDFKKRNIYELLK